MKRCRACKKISELCGARFCADCGSSELEAVSYCSHCGAIICVGDRFCPYCGRGVLGDGDKRDLGDGVQIREDLNFRIHSWLEHSEKNIYKDYSVCRRDAFSYCISDSRPNDLRIIKSYNVEPSTLYIISADVKVHNVTNTENPERPLGATISVGDSISRSLLGTSDWHTISVVGMSGEAGELELSLNLGYFCNTTSGTAWFENIRIERAHEASRYSAWRFLAVILTNTGIDTYDSDTGARVTLSHVMSDEEIGAIRGSLCEFRDALAADVDGLFGVELDIFTSPHLCTDYTKCGCGYTVSADSAYSYIRKCGIDISGYDHVIMISCLPDLPASYYGLGGLFIDGKVGFSFVLHRDVRHYLSYLGRSGGWEWPPAVYMHEFLHSIENYSASLGMPLPSIHDGKEYGYEDTEEWHGWYRDYIRKEVRRADAPVGVDPIIWRLPPSRFN